MENVLAIFFLWQTKKELANAQPKGKPIVYDVTCYIVYSVTSKIKFRQRQELLNPRKAWGRSI